MLIVAELFKRFKLFYGTGWLVTVITRLPPSRGPYPESDVSNSRLHTVFAANFNINLPSARRSSNGFFSSGFPTKNHACISHLPCLLHDKLFSASLNCSSKYHLVKSRNYEAVHCAVWLSILLFPPFKIHKFHDVPCS